MKKKIITIAGALGGGKSSTAKRVASELGYRHFSSGELFRQAAQERGVSIEEINKTTELGSSIDADVDGKLRTLGEEDGLVIDSRLAYYWIPDSFKVYLNLDVQIAAERILKQIQTEGRHSQSANSVEELVEATMMREASERTRYKNLYNLDTADLASFDLIIDTAEHDLDAVVQIVLEHYREFLKD